MSVNLQKAEFVRSAAKASDFPRDRLPQVAFAGRSNVGKSSVINRLLNRKNLARVGAAPGKTTHINYFLIDEKFYLVDLPGYGYAKVSKGERERWGRLMEEWFSDNTLMTLGMMIVDARHKPTADDQTMAEWFQGSGRPFAVVANKLDKLKKSEIASNLARIRETLGLDETVKVIPFSAEKGDGKQELLELILAHAGEHLWTRCWPRRWTWAGGRKDCSGRGPWKTPLRGRISPASSSKGANMSVNLQKAEFVRSAAKASDFPRDRLPQVAFAGRSNVGKSSVINRLLNRKNLARVGAAPGKTTHINYFLIDEKFYLVDLPGYGYAKVSKGERERWGRLMEEWFSDNTLMTLGMMIVDARHKPTADDQTMAEWFQGSGRPFAVVANKLDKLKKSEIASNLARIRETLGLDETVKVIPFSAEKGDGKQELLELILAHAGEHL